MDDSTEPLSSFTSSSNVSNGSINHGISTETRHSLELLSLSKLGSHLEQLLLDSGSNYSDADIIVDGVAVGVHRCILAARSRFFYELFNRENGSLEKEGRPKFSMTDFLPYGKVSYEAFTIFLNYLYTAKLKPFPEEVASCVNSDCTHDACRPAIDFAVELLYSSFIFQVPELVSLFQRHLLNFVGKAFVEDVIPIVAMAFHCQLNQVVTECVRRVACSDLELISIEKELPKEVAENIRLLRIKSTPDDEREPVNVEILREKRIRAIHKALDSDDVELVKLLLTESDITLNDANALHYAVAYCDPKVVSEVLGLCLSDVNLKNSRGYTVLHVAAMRKEPSVILPLLKNGACASELAFDGRTAVSICRSLTRPKDYHATVVKGQKTNNDRICIDVLERDMQRNTVAQDLSINGHAMADDLRIKLLNLENRVALAQLFFPSEAKLAMDIAHAETTSEFTGLYSALKSSSGNLREVDLNETPTMCKQRLLSRLEALMKTVDTGRRFFPHCSEVLDKFIGDDLPDLLYLNDGTPDEQKIKRKRFMDLKEDFQKAFSKDKAELDCCGLSTKSNSTTLKIGAKSKLRIVND
ncbi:BTB domain-containing protein/DUF3420 domain-containing protein/NPR1_like_C domain-containing protein/Ank_2 domain-containing protein [Cephalotus follicularis]|uniref:BTB domain-containing protein/DUF3420 domain-containing protein/NPR1_like_C domain-containing protein/Ank_2 domain-containing protein n=1 Tax=Cephalotus follicularis TaxID=3775 RepID=A0A1Q3C7G9_CEPFO|nr:BTB domain-containing protein/DUF3420 domain-containing protein/NPR1_like_C domain-containing protein/Ank_2 domain-containing protein [Cephalotus follicularis]